MLPTKCDITPEEAAEAATAIQAAIDRFPLLTDFGFGVFESHRLTAAEREEQFRKTREQMLVRRSLEDFVRAKRWLEAQTKTNNINSSAGSGYGLKHVAEVDIGCTTNGIFIAAALAAGFTVERCREINSAPPNAFLTSRARSRAPAFGRRRSAPSTWLARPSGSASPP